MDIKVPWGDGELAFAIPDDWKLLQMAEPEHKAASADWPDRLANSLDKPVAGPPLSSLLAQAAESGGKICIVVEDLTRHSPLKEILPIVLREFKYAGISDSQVFFMMAGGMHPEISREQMTEKLGDEILERFEVKFNPWDDETQYVCVGTINGKEVRTARDVALSELRIVISSVSAHLQAGFGGGYKMFYPGCSEISSIRALHKTGVSRYGIRQMVGTVPPRNRMRNVIDAAGRLIDMYHGRTFMVQYLLDDNDLPSAIACGEPDPVHQMLTKQSAVSCGVVCETQADILITNSHPRDHDLWQCFKAIPNTCWAARPGGVVICLARCPEGLNEMKTPNWPLSPYWTRKIIQWMGAGNIAQMVDRMVKKLAGDSSWFLRLATQILQRNPIYMVSPSLMEKAEGFPGIALFATVEEALESAQKLLGGGPQRVVVYPWGGASYPITSEITAQQQ